jgi:TFIIF-interacting CTD phosphatase-like protein
MQRNLGDEYYQIALRHGAIEGLKELAKNFQLVIFSHMNERYCNHIIDLFDRENIVFDAFYQRVKAFKRTDEYCNYN